MKKRGIKNISVIFLLLIFSCSNSDDNEDESPLLDDVGGSNDSNVTTGLSSRLKSLLYLNEPHLKRHQTRVNQVIESGLVDETNYQALFDALVYISQHEPAHALATIVDQIEINIDIASHGFVKTEPPSSSWNKAYECPNGGRMLVRIAVESAPGLPIDESFSYLDCRIGDVLVDGRVRSSFTRAGDVVQQNESFSDMTVSYTGNDEQSRANYTFANAEITQSVDTVRQLRVDSESHRTSLNWRSAITPFDVNLTTLARYTENSDFIPRCLSSLSNTGSIGPSADVAPDTFVFTQDSTFVSEPCDMFLTGGEMNISFEDQIVSLSANTGNPKTVNIIFHNDGGASITSIEVAWEEIPLGVERTRLLPSLASLCAAGCQ